MTTRKRNERHGRKLKVRLVLVLLLAIILIVAVVVLIVSSLGGGIASETFVFQQSDIKAVVVRDERVVTMSAYGKIEYNVDEGATVKKDDAVAEVSRMGYDDNVKQKLINLQRDIFIEQMSTRWTDVIDAEIAQTQERVLTKYNEIFNAVYSANDTNLLVLQRELQELLQDRNEMMRNKTLPTTKLTEYYQQEKILEEQLLEWKEIVLADADGRISFDIDAYASRINASTLDRLNKADISTVLKRSNVETLTTDQRPVYRIVQPDHWFLAISTNSGKKSNFHLAQGIQVKMNLHNFDDAFDAEVVVANYDKDGSYYVFEIQSDVAPIMDVRSVTADISGEFVGYTIPKNGVRFDDDGLNPTILLKDGGSIPVQVLAEDDEKYLFQSDSAAIRPGARYEAQ